MKYSKTRQFGNIGEDIACNILLHKGYLIIDRNYLRKVGEIDIVAQKNDILYFFEVKTHTLSASESNDASDNFILQKYAVSRGTNFAENNISKKKLMSLSRTIDLYLLEHNYGDYYFECHSISVYMDDSYNLIDYAVIQNINII